MRVLIRLGRAPGVQGGFGQAIESALHDLDERPGGGGEGGVGSRDEGERVVERLCERREVHPACPLAADCRAGNDRVAETAASETDGGFDSLDLDHGPQRHARPLGAIEQLSPHRIVGAVLGVVEDQRRVGQCLDRDGGAQPGRFAADDDEFLEPRDAEVEPGVVDRENDEPGLEGRVPHLVGHLRRVEADEPEPHVGVLLAEVGGEVGDQVGRRRTEHPEAERAAAEVAHLRDRVARTLDVGEHALGLGSELPARLGEDEPAPGAGEESDSELPFELPDLLRDRGLGQEQRAGGAAERSVLDGCEEVGELLNRHIGKTLV